MEGRYIKNTSPNGIDNPGFQIENGPNGDTVCDLKPNNPYIIENNAPKRRKSIVQLTREALPRLENYRNSKRAAKRPSLGELHGGDDNIKKVSFFFLVYFHFCFISIILFFIILLFRCIESKSV